MKLTITENFEPDISKYNCRNPKKLNVYIVCDYMNWNLPTFADIGAHGYICKWGGKTQVQRYGVDEVQKDLDKVYNGTGIKCSITKSGKILIPFYEKTTNETKPNISITSSESRKMWTCWRNTDTVEEFVECCKEAGISYEKIAMFYWKNRNKFDYLDYDTEETFEDVLQWVKKSYNK